jgi:hypothetical protein
VGAGTAAAGLTAPSSAAVVANFNTAQNIAEHQMMLTFNATVGTLLL